MSANAALANRKLFHRRGLQDQDGGRGREGGHAGDRQSLFAAAFSPLAWLSLASGTRRVRSAAGPTPPGLKLASQTSIFTAKLQQQEGFWVWGVASDVSPAPFPPRTWPRPSRSPWDPGSRSWVLLLRGSRAQQEVSDPNAAQRRSQRPGSAAESRFRDL